MILLDPDECENRMNESLDDGRFPKQRLWTRSRLLVWQATLKYHPALAQ